MRKLHDIQKELSTQYSIPLLSVAIADLEGNVTSLPDADLRYPIYSITKTFLAVTLLKLAEKNEINIDQKLADVIPDSPAGDRINLRQLLNHTSGLPDYFSLTYENAVKKRPRSAWSRAEYIENTNNGELLFKPGQGWTYSNLGYMFLKEVIEKITKASLTQTLAEFIFKPLKLDSCTVLNTPGESKGLVASTSFQLGNERTEFQGNYDPNWVAHGLIAANAYDIARFLHQVFLNGFLTADSLTQMTTLVRVPGSHPSAVEPSYGLGIMADPRSPLGACYGHSGSGPGFTLRANYWVGKKIIVAFGNNEDASISELANDVMRALD